MMLRPILGSWSEQETLPIYRWRKKDIEYFDVLIKKPVLSSDPYHILSSYEYFKLFVISKIL